MARSKYEKKAQKELEEQGYFVDWKIRPSGRRIPRGYRVDYFGLFDLVAYRAGDPMRWIAIKGRAGVPRILREAIANFYLPIGHQKEIWTYGRRKDKSVRKEIIP